MEPPQHASFATTRWSMVLAAGQGATPESDRALAELCQHYWYPIYAYVRRRVENRDDAHDQTQEFFARLLEKGLLARAEPTRGRFRAFLLTACRNFLANAWDHGRALKRGGGRALLSLDWNAADNRYAIEPADRWTPDRLFERQWALTLLEHALSRLRSAQVAAGKGAAFARLKPFLAGTPRGTSQAEAARALGMSEGAFKVALHRLRGQYRDLLREEVAQTVPVDTEIDEEIQALLAALSPPRP
jgi:RNA polymerase sigma-70 factor (ECF subfamily)